MVTSSRIAFGVIILGAILIVAPQLSSASVDYSQMEELVGSVEEISGHYLDTSSGLQIDLPEGWSGAKFFGLFPIIAPGGFDLSSSGEAPEALMTIFVLDSRDAPERLISVNFNEISGDLEEEISSDCQNR